MDAILQSRLQYSRRGETVSKAINETHFKQKGFSRAAIPRRLCAAMKRRFRKPFSHHGAAKAGDGAKGIEMKIKEALQTGKLRLAGLSLRTPPLQKYLDVASAGTDGVNFWQVIDLRTLDISHNEISSIPDCLRAFQSLEILSMKHNQLAVLPPAACSLSQRRRRRAQARQKDPKDRTL